MHGSENIAPSGDFTSQKFSLEIGLYTISCTKFEIFIHEFSCRDSFHACNFAFCFEKVETFITFQFSNFFN